MRASLLVVFLALVLAGCGLFSGKDDDETAGWSAQRLYGEAKDAMASKDWAQAVKYFEKLEARFPYGRFAQQAQLEIAYAHWKDGERASAIAAADRFIKLYPNHQNVDYAYYLRGLINFNDQEGLLTFLTTPDMTDRDPKASREAFESFKEVVTRFPESKYAEDSAARMRYLVNALASHEVAVARYYMKRTAYLAAANRAQYAIQHYPQTPAVEEAVYILVRAYDALGMTDLRDAADRVMQKNFPNSAYLKGGPRKANVPWWRIWDPDW
ncbi:MAG TPA: outer membrane protein assembly factor BamD [Burkholderiales bacterium]|jgi:outer membrane protein assembly factor BamD|nr:outer membrane protein assembly factor BamD [Burkholderiales bacterium]